MSGSELSTTSLASDANLTSYYRLEADSTDEQGTNDGTDTSISYVAGKFGNGARFNGSSSKIAFSSQWFPTGNFTIHCWVNIDLLSSDNRVCAQEGNGAGDHQLRVLTDGTIRMQRWTGTSNNFGQWTTSTQTVPEATWTMIDAVYDGTDVTFYVNGVSESPTDAPGNSTESAVNFQIGTAFGGFYDGIIDDFAVFDRTLSQSEIDILFASSTNTVPTALLLGVG